MTNRDGVVNLLCKGPLACTDSLGVAAQLISGCSGGKLTDRSERYRPTLTHEH